MSDPITPVTPDAPIATPPASSAEPEAFSLGKFVSSDGKFLPGWKEGLLPEDMRHRTVFDSFDDVPSALKHMGNMESMIGKKGVIVPTDKSTPSEIEAFRAAIGVPKTPADYKYEVPEALQEYYAQPLVTEAIEALHKAGATQQVFETVMALDAKRINEALAATDKEKEQELASAKAALEQKWGAAYDDRMHLANRMIAENVASEESKSRLLEKIGNDPEVADFLATIGSKFVEHRIIPNPSATITLTPAEANAKMKELMATPGYLTGDMKNANPGGYDRLQREISDMAKMASPSR